MEHGKKIIGLDRGLIDYIIQLALQIANHVFFRQETCEILADEPRESVKLTVHHLPTKLRGILAVGDSGRENLRFWSWIWKNLHGIAHDPQQHGNKKPSPRSTESHCAERGLRCADAAPGRCSKFFGTGIKIGDT